LGYKHEVGRNSIRPGRRLSRSGVNQEEKPSIKEMRAAKKKKSKKKLQFKNM